MMAPIGLTGGIAHKGGLSSSSRPPSSISRKRLVNTDENVIYGRQTEWGHDQRTPRHSAGEYAHDGDRDCSFELDLKTLEGFWSLLRSWPWP